jgi:hypothetical protein
MQDQSSCRARDRRHVDCRSIDAQRAHPDQRRVAAMKKSTPPAARNPKLRGSKQARQEAERAEAALQNTREGYGNNPQNDREANNESGMGSVGGGRDMTSGRRSGNQ